MAKINGGELLVRTLRQAGVEAVFGLHGAHIDAIFQACVDHDLPIIDTRHEAAAGHAAEGYARTANRLGVALITAGGGFTNVMTSIANAFFDRTPVLYITGSGALRDAETNTLQAGIDQVAMAKPITKWATQITVTQNIPRILAQALRTAQSGPRGPVLVDIPWDVLTNQIEEADAPIPAEFPIAAPAPSAAAISQILAVLATASRPVMVLGSEAARSGAAAAVTAFAEASGMPVFAEYEACGLLPAGHALNGGPVQNLLNVNAAQKPDVVLMLGVRFGLYTGHGSGALLPREAQIVQIDTDARELGRLQDVALSVIADPRETLLALLAGAGGVRWADKKLWAEAVRRAVAGRRARIEAEVTHGPLIHPFRAVAEIAKSVPPDTVIVADGAEAYTWFTEVLAPRAPGRFLTHSYLGSMGVGLGIAVGAQVAARGGPVVLVTGDGAVGFSIAEFDTMVRKKLPIVVVVMNNRSWGATLHFQKAIVGPERVHYTTLDNGEYHDAAAAFGAVGYHVTAIDALGPAIRAAIAARKPACINVRVALDPAPPETRLMMGDNPFA